MLKTVMTETYRPTGKEVSVCDGRYLLRKKIGRGSFGDIYMGFDTKTSNAVAIKLEKKSIHYPQLEYEMNVYQLLNPFRKTNATSRSSSPHQNNSSNPLSGPQVPIVPGIPRAHCFVKEGEYNVMVLDLCGPSLEDLFNYCHRRFSLKTVVMVAEQMLHRIEYVHSRGFLHRDIKPENFVFGRGPLGHVLHMIDFGLAKPYLDKRTKRHINFAERKPLTGTARYCACNAHRGYEQSRRDDLESIGFLLIYFAKGVLPWQGIQGKDQRIKTQKIGEKKMATPLDTLCDDLPSAFLAYMTYCRHLEFQQEPDYELLREMFRNVAREHHYISSIPNFPSVAHGVSSFDTSIYNSSVQSPMAGSRNNHLIGGNGDNSSENASYETIHVMDDEEVQGRQNPMNSGFSPRATARGSNNMSVMSNNSIKAPPVKIYDWSFDWFCKRTEELRDYKKNRGRKNNNSSTKTQVGSKAK